MTLISTKVYIDKLDDIVNEYNNTYHNTIKIKPVDVKPNAYIDSSQEINYQDPKFKILIQLEHQNTKAFLQKSMFQSRSEEVFVIGKIKNSLPRAYVISDLKGEVI